MTSHTNLARAGVILLFAITFMIIGTSAPVVYASYAPADQIIEEENFTAADTTVNADSHHICFDRTVHRSTSGLVFTELYLVNGGDERVSVSSETTNRYFQDGRAEITTEMDLPDDLEAGEYRYVLVIQAELANGRVTRDFVFESERFTISNGTIEEQVGSKAC